MNQKNFIPRFTTLIGHAVRLSEIAGNRGLSALEDDLEDLDDADFKQGLRFVVDETPAAIIDEIFTNKIAFATDDYERRYKTITKIAVLGIQEGLNVRLLVHVLLSYANLPKAAQWEIEFNFLKD